MQEILKAIDEHGLKHIRTLGNVKEYEKAIGIEKLRVRPSAKTTVVERDIIGVNVKRQIARVSHEEAIKIIESFDCLGVLYAE